MKHPFKRDLVERSIVNALVRSKAEAYTADLGFKRVTSGATLQSLKLLEFEAKHPPTYHVGSLRQNMHTLSALVSSSVEWK